jgi:phosphoglycerate dehydrogenase-like enzyme
MLSAGSDAMKIALLSPIWPAAVAELRKRCTVVAPAGLTPQALLDVLRDADVAVLRSGVRLDREVLVAAARLRLLVRAGVGLEGIDLATAHQRGVRVVCVPLSAESVAEHTLGLLLALSHRIAYHDRLLRQGRWEKHAGHGCDLRGRTLGLLGFGRIGIRTAELARAFGMPVWACDRSPDRPHKQEAATRLGVRFVGLEELFAGCDAVAIQVPLDDTTRGLVDARLLARMKPGALLVNVGRGRVLDEVALDEALRAGRLGGAALDVFGIEPVGNSPLLTLDNFVGTPHVAAQTVDAQQRVGEVVVQVIDAFAAGADPARYGVEVRG